MSGYGYALCPCHECTCDDPVCVRCGRAPCPACGEALEDCAGHDGAPRPTPDTTEPWSD